MPFRASLLASVSVVAFTNAVTAGPQGGSVVSGTAVISTPGPQSLTVTQTSPNAIINWQGFSVRAGESASFVTPTGGATLNRVTGADPSSIYGTLTSTGRLFLINPNGIVVGPTGVIDTAGLVLSTHSVKDAQFLAGGDMTFSGDSNASVVNRGTIRSTGGGDVFLIARHVENAGSISAPGGAVGLAGGTEVLIRATDTADGRIAVRKGPGSVRNAGDIAATTAELRAAGGNHYALAVNNTGVVRATGVKTQNGRVFLTANTGNVSSSGKVTARNANGSGGKVKIATAPRPAASATRRAAAVQSVVDISGTVDVSAVNGAGGSVVIEAEAISIASTARIDASGPAGGGFIAIGGGFQGKDVSILNADDVTVASGAQIVADATDKGNGGKISIWADGSTTFQGAISARGGASGGDGGFAEVSGKETIAMSGHADMRAPMGSIGTLLIDPGSVTIVDGPNGFIDVNTFSDAWISSQLGLASVSILTSAANAPGPEDITVKNGVSIVWNGATLLSLRAGNDIIVENNVTISNTQTGNGSTSFVQKDAGGVELLAGANITIGDVAQSGSIRIGSEFGVTKLVAGDANFNGLPDAPGTGKITISAGLLENSHVQIGYRQPANRGANTGQDFAAPALHAENGTITVLAGGDITLAGGSSNGTFAQIGHGGATTGETAEILRSDISVISSGGSVKLDSRGLESGFAKIGHGSYFDQGNFAILRAISGDIHVDALTSVVLNGAPTPSDTILQNGVADVFLARIGHGSHAYLVDSATLVAGDMAGAIYIGAKDNVALSPATPLALVQLGSAISPGALDDAREVFSQIGHGTQLRMVALTQAGGGSTVQTGAVRSYLNINGFATARPDISVKADEILLNSIIASPLNALANIERASIGAGNYVRLQAGAPINQSVLDGSVVVAGVNVLVDGLTLPQALDSDLSQLTAAEVAKLRALAAANTTIEAMATATATDLPFNVVLREGDLTGNVLVSTNAGTGKGVTLSSLITVADKAVTGNYALTRIGHGGFVQLTTPNGAAAVIQNPGPAKPSAAGGFISYTEANVLYSTIRVETNNNDDVTANVSVTAGAAAATKNVLGAAIGSGNEAFLITGAGGAVVGISNSEAIAGASGGDVLYRRGTVWDGAYTSSSPSTGDDGYDTTITIASQNNIKVATSATAAVGAAGENVVLGRIGHGAVISVLTGAGGAGQTGSNGGRGGDIRMEQQTPGRDYGINGAADDRAWGLRGQIALQASDLTATPALEITSAATAASAAARSNTISSRVGHGDQIMVSTGAGGSGAQRAFDLLVTTAHGGRGGHVSIAFAPRLIESTIAGLVGGEIKIDASTTNAAAASTKNISEAAVGHGDSVQALSGAGGAGGGGTFLTNGVTVANSQAAAEEFFGAGLFSSESGSGAARGGNGGDISINLGAITERRGPVSGFSHDADANIDLTITGANPNKRSLTVNSLIAPAAANGPGDQVTANVGHNTRVIALAGVGGAGGGTSPSTLDIGFAVGAPTRTIQNDNSGGRGGDIRIVAGAHDSRNAPIGATGAPADTLVIGRVIVNADEQVAVTSTAGPGAESRAHSGIGHLNDIVALTSAGGRGGAFVSFNPFIFATSPTEGLRDSAQQIQVIVNRDGSRGVSLANNGVADTIQSVAARRSASPVNGSTANPSFFDVDGNPEFILDANNNLVANVGANNALRSAWYNVARFGRIVEAYNPGVSNLERVQYVDINNDGRPDVVAAVLSNASAITLVDADNSNVYDQIAGRVRLPDGNLAPLGLVDYVYATGRTAGVAGNRLDWTYADFATANGGRGGDAAITTGVIRPELASAPLITVNAGVSNSGAPAADPNFSLVVSSVMQATPVSAGPANVASARVGVADYLYSATDVTYNRKLSGALHALASGGASDGNAGVGGVNANGGRGGDASVLAGAVQGHIAINPDAPLTRGVKVSSFTDDVTSRNRSSAAIGHGGEYVASADNSGGLGNSQSQLQITLTESANGGRGGAANMRVMERTGDISVRAGSAEAGGDFAIVIEAIKGGSTAVADSVNNTFANVGHGGIYRAMGGLGGGGDDGQYMGNGGVGGAATIDVALTSGAIGLDAVTYSDKAFGSGVRIEASTSEGGQQRLRAQAGHYGWATATGGGGGGGATESRISEQFNQQANGGAGGTALINHAGFAGAVTIEAGAARSGDNAILIKSSDNTVNSRADNFILATAGHGAFADATGGAGGQSGRRDAIGGLTLEADPAFNEGFDIANPSLSATAPLDRNPIMFGTVRDGGDGGAGGAAAILIGATSGDITLRAHDVDAAGGKDGILITALAGDGANMRTALFGNVAMVGHGHNASASGREGGSSISRTLAATVTSGDGGDGGSGSVTFGAIAGAISVTNVVAGEANDTGGARDKNIRIFASDQDATDNADHRATARVGHRTIADAFGGAGGNAALPPPGPMYSATLSAQGGFGGSANITSGAISGGILIVAENSVLIDALNPTVSSPTVVAGAGHHAIANVVVAGGGGFGGVSASFNDAAMLTALRRYVDLGQNYSALSELEKQLVAPVLKYYRIAPVYTGAAGAGASPLPASFVERVLAGPAAFVAGSPNGYPLARDNDAIAGTANSIPTVSVEERNSLIALSMASGHGGAATVTQGAITAGVSINARSANTSDPARGFQLKTLGVLNAGTQIAHVGNENEVSRVTSGKGQNVHGGTIAEGIGGDGGAVAITQGQLGGDIAILAGVAAGANAQSASGDIHVSSTGALTSGWQRSLIGHRQMIGSDDPGFRTEAVVRAGDGGGDQDALALGKLGNGGSVAINQASVTGALNLMALGPSPSGDSIQVISIADLTSGETLSSIGHAMVVDSVKAGDAIPYTVGPDARASLYGVREGNGGTISIGQGALGGDLTLAASDNLLVESATALASGRATTLIGHKQIVADKWYGTRAGAVIAGNGADVLSLEDIDVANGAPGFVNSIHANPVQDGDGGNFLLSQGLIGGAVLLHSELADVLVLANGNTGETTTLVGHQRFTQALTGQGGVTAGPAGPRSAGEGGAAIIETAALGADINIVAAKKAIIKSTSALGSDASVLVGMSTGMIITTGRSGYGAALFSVAANLQGLPPDDQLTTRDAARIIQHVENAVAAITIANRYAEHYSPAQQADLAKALTDATNALASLRTAPLANVRAIVATARNALNLATDSVIAGGNPNGIADAADSGSIVYVTPSVVSGNISVRGTDVVAVQAEGGDGATSLVEIGHRHGVLNTTGVGDGLTVGGPLDGGVAGDSGSITVQQRTSGNVELISERIVVNPTSGVGRADVHLSHRIELVNTTGKADIEGLLGRGGAISSLQDSRGDVLLRGSQYSSSPTGAADGLLMADGGPGASRLRIGVEAVARQLSNSDEMIAGLGGPDNNRGGVIQAGQTVVSGIRIEGPPATTDLIIRSVGLADKEVRIGALATQTARSGNPVDDGSSVTALQAVSGNIATQNIEDLVVENIGPGVSTVHIGHTVSQSADSGETAGLTSQHGGITRADQSVSGAIGLVSTRSFTQQTDGVGSGFNHIGHSGVQTARSADQRTAASPADYPIVPGAPTGKFNVVSTQTVRADVSVASGEILIQSLNGAADGPGTIEGGVRLGNTAQIVVDTHNLGRVQSTQTLGGNVGLTTIAPAVQREALITTAVNGDIRVLTPAKPGTVNVGHESTSTVSHDPAAFQPTGVFVTQQNIVDNIVVTALRNVEVRDGEAGAARIGHTIQETSALSTTNAVKTSAQDPSTVAQSIDSNIVVTAGNSLAMVTTAGVAQIGHYSPGSNQWQVTGGRVVTPQTIIGNVDVYVGLNTVATVVGEAPAVGALGTNNALLDGTAGGEVRIGHTFAPFAGASANEVQTAAGDIWVEVGAHLHVKTANIGHGPYDFASAAVSKDNAVMGEGAVRNRIAGLTTIGAAQNTPSPQDTMEPNILLFDGANVNSGYGENGGQLRFFIPSRRNLTITDTAPTQFNDSTSKADAIPPRSDSADLIEGAVTHENGFLAMSTTALYADIGEGNFAFYFADPVSPSYVVNPWDGLHRVEGLGGSCIDTKNGGVNAGALRRNRNALAWAQPLAAGENGQGCNGQASTPGAPGFTFVPAGSSTRSAPQRQSGLQGGVVQIVAGPAGAQHGIVIRTASPAPVIRTPAVSGATATGGASAPTSVPLHAVRVSGGRILSFATSGTNLVATISSR